MIEGWEGSGPCLKRCVCVYDFCLVALQFREESFEGDTRFYTCNECLEEPWRSMKSCDIWKRAAAAAAASESA